MRQYQGKLKLVPVDNKDVIPGRTLKLAEGDKGIVRICQRDGDFVLYEDINTPGIYFSLTLHERGFDTFEVEFEFPHDSDTILYQHYPLAYSQWEFASKHPALNKNQSVPFIIYTRNIVSLTEDNTHRLVPLQIAKLVQDDPATWDYIESLAYDEWKEVGGLSTFEPWFINWLKDNYHSPKKK